MIFLNESSDKTDDLSAYQKHFIELLKKVTGKTSITDLSKEEKINFFNKVDASWNSAKEPGKDGKTGK